MKEKDEVIDLTVNDLVFVTNGSCTERSMLGDQNTAPDLNIKMVKVIAGNYGKNMAIQSEEFGHPEKFCMNIKETNWESATKLQL